MPPSMRAAALLVLASALAAHAFVPLGGAATLAKTRSSAVAVSSRTQSYTASARRRAAPLLMSTAPSIQELGLTPELERLVKAFRSMPDDKMRYKQLLFMAAQGAELPSEFKTTDNKVQGCLSTVHVVAKMKQGKVYFEGDSDAQLTKGLLSILIRGLSGNAAADIQSVKPEFIQVAGLQTSLTPGRNNGFINMLSTMKRKALQAEAEAETATAAAPEAVAAGGAEAGSEGDDMGVAEVPGKPMTTAIMRKLQALRPVRLQVEDESEDEQKFYIAVVSSAFEGLPLVKRHQLVHLTIADEMKQVHAVQLSTKTPAEMGL
eukprot:TRINITY_DN7640_c0_g1_i1.p1 TRINITY_DN7640_c0_g1~~TRINITY_DN7640_c0_g1_i1.p1  ORF type:complete len:334 (+),score=115.50 TRINITY_DN7640_c0_g1_i1:47-1003(+)